MLSENIAFFIYLELNHYNNLLYLQHNIVLLLLTFELLIFTMGILNIIKHN